MVEVHHRTEQDVLPNSDLVTTKTGTYTKKVHRSPEIASDQLKVEVHVVDNSELLEHD